MLEHRRAEATRISHIQVVDHDRDARIRDLTDRAKRDTRAVRLLASSLLLFAPAAMVLRWAQSYITLDALFIWQGGIPRSAAANNILVRFLDWMLVATILVFAMIMIRTAAPHRFHLRESIASVLAMLSISPRLPKDEVV